MNLRDIRTANDLWEILLSAEGSTLIRLVRQVKGDKRLYRLGGGPTPKVVEAHLNKELLILMRAVGRANMGQPLSAADRELYLAYTGE
jgi:hypothetical protein